MPRTRSLLPMLAMVLALSACNSGDKAPAAQQAPAPPPLDQPARDIPPATAPATATKDVGMAHYGGYGDLRFGMNAVEVKAAWDGELNGNPEQESGCYYFNPVGNPSIAYLAFMMEGDKFVRYDVSNDKDVAPGGGKVGMDTDQIKALYPDRVETGPHKYVEGGKVLRIKADDGSGDVLVFETDADGKITAWRAGQPPAVDYVEGCS